MRKIYNEVVIDMNPESSSYGETLHEDWFMDDGPIAECVVLNKPEDWFNPGGWNMGKYESHWNFGGAEYPGYYTMSTKRGGQKWMVVVSPSGEVVWSKKVGSTPDYTSLEEEAVQSLGAPGTGYSAETQEAAKNINYSEFSKFIDPNTGDISDKQGMLTYLEDVSGKGRAELSALMENIPKLNISAADMSQAKGQKQSDVYGLQSSLMGERGKAATEAGASGVYSPTSTGFGGTDADEGTYGQLGAAAVGEGGDAYGLGEEKEKTLLSWLEGLG